MLQNADCQQVNMSNKEHWASNRKRFRLMPFFISVKSLMHLLIWVFQKMLKQRLLIFLLKSAMYSLSQERSKLKIGNHRILARKRQIKVCYCLR